MPRLYHVLLAILVTHAPPSLAHGQGENTIQIGDLLRVEPVETDRRVIPTILGLGDQLIGTLVRYDDQRLHMQVGAEPVAYNPLAYASIAPSEIRKLEVSIGPDRRKSAAWGAGIGVVSALAFAMAVPSPAGEGAGSSMFIAAPLVGLPVGAALGWLMAPHRWIEVSAPYKFTSGGGETR